MNQPQAHTFQPDIYPKVLSLIPDDGALRILDAGAGEGYFTRILVDRGQKVEACDMSREWFAVPDVPFHEANLNAEIPVAGDTFDMVVSIEVLEHLENHAQFIRELVRVTKPGGTIILTTPNVVSLTSRWHFFLYGYTDCSPRPLDSHAEDVSMQHINPASLPEMIFNFERAGAEIVDVTTNRIRKSSRVPMALLYPLLAGALRAKLLRSRFAEMHPVFRRHIRWMLSKPALMGRINIVVARKVV